MHYGLINSLLFSHSMQKQPNVDIYEAARIYSKIPANKRLAIGIGMFVFSLGGIWGASKLEEIMPAKPLEKSKEQIERERRDKLAIAKELD
jgi:hypothetical protein